MSRTYRNPQGYYPGWGSWVSILDSYDCKRRRRDYYIQAQLNAGRKIAWMDKFAAATDEELMAEAVNEYNRQSRDGRDGWTCSKANTGFKKQCARHARNANKQYCNRVMHDEYEGLPYPRYNDTKKFFWDWW